MTTYPEFFENEPLLRKLRAAVEPLAMGEMNADIYDQNRFPWGLYDTNWRQYQNAFNSLFSRVYLLRDIATRAVQKSSLRILDFMGPGAIFKDSFFQDLARTCPLEVVNLSLSDPRHKGFKFPENPNITYSHIGGTPDEPNAGNLLYKETWDNLFAAAQPDGFDYIFNHAGRGFRWSYDTIGDVPGQQLVYDLIKCAAQMLAPGGLLISDAGPEYQQLRGQSDKAFKELLQALPGYFIHKAMLPPYNCFIVLNGDPRKRPLMRHL